MELGMIGLGRMGGNMVRRLLKDKHKVVVFDHHPENVAACVAEGALGSRTIQELVENLKSPKAVWSMVPAGDPTEQLLNNLAALLSPGDVVVEGGNSLYHDSIRRAQTLSAKEIFFLDVGTSGGIWGLEKGYCLMIGGKREIFDRLAPIFKTLAPPDGYLYVGPSGSGHFVKMIHNGIEYGLLQAYAEGFSMLKAAPFPLDFQKISHLWNQGSVVRSWLLELAERAFSKDPNLSSVRGFVEDSGEGRWTVQEAVRCGVPLPAITASLYERFLSRQEENFGDQFIAALRQEFGGHGVKH